MKKDRDEKAYNRFVSNIITCIKESVLDTDKVYPELKPHERSVGMLEAISEAAAMIMFGLESISDTDIGKEGEKVFIESVSNNLKDLRNVHNEKIEVLKEIVKLVKTIGKENKDEKIQTIIDGRLINLSFEPKDS